MIDTRVWHNVKFTHSCTERSDSVHRHLMCRINTHCSSHTVQRKSLRDTLTDQRLPDTPAYELWLRYKRSERLLSSRRNTGEQKTDAEERNYILWQSYGIRSLNDGLTKTFCDLNRQTAPSEMSLTDTNLQNRNKDHSTIRTTAFLSLPSIPAD